VEFCPKDALATDEMEKAKLVYPEKCNSCGMCELLCPDLAIELK
jgi:2-oxoglutarate ferredoxin oxidoreductase subunit delta